MITALIHSRTASRIKDSKDRSRTLVKVPLTFNPWKRPLNSTTGISFHHFRLFILFFYLSDLLKRNQHSLHERWVIVPLYFPAGRLEAESFAGSPDLVLVASSCWEDELPSSS